MLRNWNGLITLLLALLMLACTRPIATSEPIAEPTHVSSPLPTLGAPTVEPGYSAEQLHGASDMAPIRLPDGDLRLIASAIQVAEYLDEAGNPQRGLTAVLTIYSATDPTIDLVETIYVGKILYVGTYRIRVTDISPSGDGVILKIAKKLDP